MFPCEYCEMLKKTFSKNISGGCIISVISWSSTLTTYLEVNLQLKKNGFKSKNETLLHNFEKRKQDKIFWFIAIT